jgi:hypothetical protein
MDRYQYTPPAMQIDPAKPFYFSSHNAHQCDTVSAEHQDEPSSPTYLPNIVTPLSDTSLSPVPWLVSHSNLLPSQSAARTRFQHWLAPAFDSTIASQNTFPSSSSPFPRAMPNPSVIPTLLSPVDNQQNALGLMTDLYDSDVHNPINTLPPKVLAETFVLCLPPRVWRPPTLNVREAPMLLCQVCSYWKELVLSLPMLWSSFSGSCRRYLQVRHDSLIQLWLERSRTHPPFLYLFAPTRPAEVVYDAPVSRQHS